MAADEASAAQPCPGRYTGTHEADYELQLDHDGLCHAVISPMLQVYWDDP